MTAGAGAPLSPPAAAWARLMSGRSAFQYEWEQLKEDAAGKGGSQMRLNKAEPGGGGGGKGDLAVNQTDLCTPSKDGDYEPPGVAGRTGSVTVPKYDFAVTSREGAC
ncbi:hypothetical protein C5F59_010775 [Streptomyces sp. QL37]|uniref:hypothetical protein n=1 Tax=Streptomyces sp. QL37 TaxID=2093747 RepID=UPI000CF289C2|nr:hypothetical protein [Streptomyces sp. QL37]PPQ60082.1 hypothetical protein C5F59_27970 [Streptomyces sp. QL37]